MKAPQKPGTTPVAGTEKLIAGSPPDGDRGAGWRSKRRPIVKGKNKLKVKT